MTSFRVAPWFTAFVDWLRTGPNARELIEVLSDSSNELHANALVARHMRSYGQRLHERFWVRTEWDKCDISFGIATKLIEEWETAWVNNQTGDLGVIEAKVLYSHYTRSKVVSKASQLAAKLEDTAKHSPAWRRPRAQRFFGLVWLMSFAPASDTRRHFHSALGATLQWIDVGSLDLSPLWPRRNVGRAVLSIGAAEWRKTGWRPLVANDARVAPQQK